jgi:hypothetical protein
MLAITREKVLEHLREVPRLADLYRDRDPAFRERVLDWLSQVEQSLGRLRNPLASRAAAERTTILAVADGLREPGIDGSVGLRKATRATVSLALRRVERALRELVETTDRKLDEGREKMTQLLAVATTAKPIPLPPTEPRQAWLEKVWRSLETSNGTQGMYAYLNAALRPSDRLYLLDEIVTNLVRSAAAEPGS